MYRTVARAVPRAAVRRTLFPPRLPAVRFASSSASGSGAKKSTWRGAALRWGAAVAAVYFYNTSSLFEDDPHPTKTVPPPPQFSDDEAPTVEAVIVQKRKQAEAKAMAKQNSTEKDKSKTKSSADASPDGSAKAQAATPPGEEGMAELEEEAGQEAAFNPETGEINWDCPCLGGMAHGPCGEEFKGAFSCFVYSEEEPKGIDCIDKFQAMQDCFRKYPEIYGDELHDDDEEEGGDALPQPPSENGENGEVKPTASPVEEKTEAPKEEAVPKENPPPAIPARTGKEEEKPAAQPVKKKARASKKEAPAPEEDAPPKKKEKAPMYDKQEDGAKETATQSQTASEKKGGAPPKPQGPPKDPMRDAS